MTRRLDTVDKIIQYEAGEMTSEEEVEFFQDLIDSGVLWQLQGHYQRTARAMAEADVSDCFFKVTFQPECKAADPMINNNDHKDIKCTSQGSSLIFNKLFKIKHYV